MEVGVGAGVARLVDQARPEIGTRQELLLSRRGQEIDQMHLRVLYVKVYHRPSAKLQHLHNTATPRKHLRRDNRTQINNDQPPQVLAHLDRNPTAPMQLPRGYPSKQRKTSLAGVLIRLLHRRRPLQQLHNPSK